MAHPPPTEDPDRARRRIILDALLGEVRHVSWTVDACARWDQRFKMREAEEVFRNLSRHRPTEAPERYRTALRAAAAAWMRPTFLRSVAHKLRQFGFPDVVAALIAPRMLYVYLDWAGAHVPPEQPWPDEAEGGPPSPSMRQAAAAVRGMKRRGPRRDVPYETWAHWFYRVDVLGQSQASVAGHFARPVARPARGSDGVVRFVEIRQHPDTRSRAVRRALTKARRLFGLPLSRESSTP